MSKIVKFLVFILLILSLIFLNILFTSNMFTNNDNNLTIDDLEKYRLEQEKLRNIEYNNYLNNYNKENTNLLNICIPKGIESKIYIDGSYIGTTNNYSNCLSFKPRHIRLIELKTKWNTYNLDYNNTFVNFSINIENNINLLRDKKEYEILLNYVDKISVNDKTLNIFASRLTNNCDSGDNMCEIATIFNFVTNKIKYRSDTRATENIKDPFETLDSRAGDCEDQAILLNSLLEQLGHKTYLLFTETHAFSLVCISEDDYNYELYKYVPDQAEIFSWDSISPGEICLYADPTVTNGYLGYKTVFNKNITAFDSYTKEQVLLKS